MLEEGGAEVVRSFQEEANRGFRLWLYGHEVVGMGYEGRFGGGDGGGVVVEEPVADRLDVKVPNWRAVEDGGIGGYECICGSIIRN